MNLVLFDGKVSGSNSRVAVDRVQWLSCRKLFFRVRLTVTEPSVRKA